VLSIDHLRYRYSPESITYHYDMTLMAGSICGILGESGSGKSTLLDLISGFLEASQGSISLDGENILQLPVEKRPVTILFQQHNLFEHLSVYTNLLLGINPKGRATPQADKQIASILKEMGLDAYRDLLPTRLSGGEQQRVALARALLRQRPILLLDEPFSALDRKTRLEMLALVRNITTHYGLHTLMVTHEPEDCVRIADKSYKMNHGRLSPYAIPKEC